MIDWNKPYGTIVGHPMYRFEQDGVFYNAEGDPVSETKPPVPEVKTIEVSIDKRRNWTPERRESHRKNIQAMWARRRKGE